VRITFEVRGDEPAVEPRSEEDYHAAINGGRSDRIKELAAKRMRARGEATLEATQGQILSQSPTSATSSR